MLRGSLDSVGRERIAGWAQDREHPERAVTVLVTANGELLGRGVANTYRPDLAAAGLGAGRHGFELTLPPGLVSSLTRHVVRAVHEADGTELAGSPQLIEAATTFGSDTRAEFEVLLDGAESEPDITAQIEFLAGRIAHLTQRLADRRSGRQWRQYHAARWQHDCRGPEVDAAAAPALRALVVDGRLPGSGRHVAAATVVSHVGALRRLGHEVSFVPADMCLQDGPRVAALAAMGVECYGLPLFGSVEELLRRQAGDFALVLLHGLANAAKYSALVRHHCPDAHLVCCLDELLHLRVLRQGSVEGRAELAEASHRIRVAELLAARQAITVITTSQTEAALLLGAVPGVRAQFVPRSVAVRPTSLPVERRHGIGFIGDPRHGPDLDAARWLVRDILPLVRRQVPEIECLLVGGFTPGDLGGTDPGVVVVNTGAALAPLFDRVRLTIAPLAFGAGIKGEILQSLAAGIPCVCTPLAAEGLGWPAALDACIAREPAGLAAATVALHGDLAWNRQAAEAGLAHIAQDHSQAAVDLAMRRALSLSPREARHC